LTDLVKINFVKFEYGGMVSGLSQFLLLPQLPQKIIVALKVIKIDSKSQYKAITHSEESKLQR